MRLVLIFTAAFALSACSDEPEADNAPTDYAAINKAAVAPPAPITPDVITFAEIEKYNLFGAGCNVPDPSGEGLYLIADDTAAYFLLDGKLIDLAPVPGSEQLPYGTLSRYDGLAHSIELTIDTDSEDVEAPEVVNYQGHLVIRDEMDRPVFEQVGLVVCGA